MIKRGISLFVDGTNKDRATIFGKIFFVFFAFALVGFVVGYFIDKNIGSYIVIPSIVFGCLSVVLAMVFSLSKDQE